MISTIIVNWNSGTQLNACVNSLLCTNTHQIIVVDNASTDGSEQGIENHPGVTLIRSPENLGFGKACNLGARYATSEYLLFLNPDATVFPGTIEKSLAFMQDPANSQVGICGVQLVDENGRVSRSCARFPSSTEFVACAIGLDRLFPRLGFSMREWTHDKTRDVDHVMGAFFLVRQTVFESLGGFDERFFVYLEDLDFSFRARHAGWRSVYLSDVQAFHLGGGTSRQIKARRMFYSIRSRLLYTHKHFNFFAAAPVFFATFLIEPVSRTLVSITRFSWTALKETWSGYAMLVHWMPVWIFRGVTR